jgi:hypothetical protein
MKFISKEELAKKRPHAPLREGKRMEDHVRLIEMKENRNLIAEFIGSGDFAAAFSTRQQYEIDAGRQEEPLLYTSFYNIVVDRNLPETVEVSKLGPGGVVFEEVLEGGEVKFMTITEGTYSITQRQFGVGLEYSKRMVKFNQIWNMAIAERAVGIGYNALMNHLHLSPILTYSYAAANQTAADSTGSTLMDKYVNTFSNAIETAMSDTANPRRGRYDLLVNPGQYMKVKRALQLRSQDSGGEVFPGLDMIDNVIAYGGGTYTRGKKETTYAGVTANKAYLISKQYSSKDFQSWQSQGLESQVGDGDVSRFIMEQIVWDCFIGIYSNPAGSVEEITLPTS